MQGLNKHGHGGKRLLDALLLLTLISSAVHFADKALRLDLYPGPAWLTRNVVLTTWLFVLAAAVLAYRLGSLWALVAWFR
jgi:hypothetical protein